MATCRGCSKMGYPLQCGFCAGCRDREAGAKARGWCRLERERGWNASNRIIYNDPPPLMGDQYYPQAEWERRLNPLRRSAVTLCDCQTCKAAAPRRTLPADSYRDPCSALRVRRSGPSPARGAGTPSRRVPGASPARGVAGRPPARLSGKQQEQASSPSERYDAAQAEQEAYEKLWSAYQTIRAAVLEQQQEEDQRRSARRNHQGSESAAHWEVSPSESRASERHNSPRRHARFGEATTVSPSLPPTVGAHTRYGSELYSMPDPSPGPTVTSPGAFAGRTPP
eukprot:TRINITY_DN24711_c0_g1_i1.p1 TRINITY_DN24711_c0_g1~~TRINITY_DN24711_c0_g1_i1.p1  ORF type:complete len:313 (+),score=58.01 TRINITY_DN24711_c0_g1_i1:95-940(+)